MSKWGANIVNCIWINWNHWAKYLKASITKEWNGWTHALFEIFAFATNGDGGDSGSVSSNDNGGIDDPNVCEKLHELVLTSTEKSGFHAHPYTQRRRRRRMERFSFYDCRTQMQQSVLMCVLSKANVDITQEWQAHKTYTHTHICTEKERKRIHKERDIGVLMLLREMILCANSYLSNTEYFGRRHYASLNVLPCSWCWCWCWYWCWHKIQQRLLLTHGAHLTELNTASQIQTHAHWRLWKKASGCAHLNVCVPMTDFP